MHMALSKRTHIMLDPQMFEWLKNKAETKKVTMGSLVRDYLEEKFQTETDSLTRDRTLWWKRIQKLRTKHQFTEPIDFKELINHGRKY